MTTHEVPTTDPGVVAFYAAAYDEAARLSETAEGRLELLRTRELLERWLPRAPADVLDVGGGPGAHAAWLVEAGYRVRVVDPVERHVRAAERVGATAEVGDARRLTAADASYDVVLCLGPLYHLRERPQRMAALAEALRVVRPGGAVAVAAINRHAALFEHASAGTLEREPLRRVIASIIATGDHDGVNGFTAAHFHTPAELAEELAAAGLDGPELYGVEGPAWSLLRAGDGDRLFDSVLAAARLADAHPDLLSAGSHLLAVGRRPTAAHG